MVADGWTQRVLLVHTHTKSTQRDTRQVGKEVVKIPGSGKSKVEKNDEGSGGGGGDGAGKKKKVMAAGDFSPPRSAAQQQGKKGGKPRTQNALNSLSEFSAG